MSRLDSSHLFFLHLFFVQTLSLQLWDALTLGTRPESSSMRRRLGPVGVSASKRLRCLSVVRESNRSYDVDGLRTATHLVQTIGCQIVRLSDLTIPIKDKLTLAISAFQNMKDRNASYFPADLFPI